MFQNTFNMTLWTRRDIFSLSFMFMNQSILTITLAEIDFSLQQQKIQLANFPV